MYKIDNRYDRYNNIEDRELQKKTRTPEIEEGGKEELRMWE